MLFRWLLQSHTAFRIEITSCWCWWWLTPWLTQHLLRPKDCANNFTKCHLVLRKKPLRWMLMSSFFNNVLIWDAWDPRCCNKLLVPNHIGNKQPAQPGFRLEYHQSYDGCLKPQGYLQWEKNQYTPLTSINSSHIQEISVFLSLGYPSVYPPIYLSIHPSIPSLAWIVPFAWSVSLLSLQLWSKPPSHPLSLLFKFRLLLEVFLAWLSHLRAHMVLCVSYSGVGSHSEGSEPQGTVKEDDLWRDQG